MLLLLLLAGMGEVDGDTAVLRMETRSGATRARLRRLYILTMLGWGLATRVVVVVVGTEMLRVRVWSMVVGTVMVVKMVEKISVVRWTVKVSLMVCVWIWVIVSVTVLPMGCGRSRRFSNGVARTIALQ